MRSERHDEQRSVDDTRTPHERFTELGKRLMSVSKPELDEQEKTWQSARKRTKKRR
jgi:hypothetical protein